MDLDLIYGLATLCVIIMLGMAYDKSQQKQEQVQVGGGKASTALIIFGSLGLPAALIYYFFFD